MLNTGSWHLLCLKTNELTAHLLFQLFYGDAVFRLDATVSAREHHGSNWTFLHHNPGSGSRHVHDQSGISPGLTFIKLLCGIRISLTGIYSLKIISGYNHSTLYRDISRAAFLWLSDINVSSLDTLLLTQNILYSE